MVVVLMARWHVIQRWCVFNNKPMILKWAKLATAYVKTCCLHWNSPDGSRNLQSAYHLSTCNITEGAQVKENQKTPISISSGLLHPFGVRPTNVQRLLDKGVVVTGRSPDHECRAFRDVCVRLSPLVFKLEGPHFIDTNGVRLLSYISQIIRQGPDSGCWRRTPTQSAF